MAIDILEFSASAVSCYTENDVVTIGVGDDEHSPEHYLIITYLEEGNSPKDTEIGLQTNLSETECSAAISQIKLKTRLMEIFIRKEMVPIVGASTIRVHLDCNSTELTKLSRYLSSVFDGSGTQLNIELAG